MIEPLRKPRTLVSEEVSAVLTYLRELEDYARQLETACEQLLIANRALMSDRDAARRAAETDDDPPF